MDAIEPVPPDCMDVPKIAERYGSRLTLIGTIGTAQFWDWARPQQVRAAVRERIAQFTGRGGLILAPAYDLLPQTPYENAVAVFDEARGSYE